MSARKTGSQRKLRIVVTAGPTREYLDDVRFLSNASSGRMGHAIAREATKRGAEVVLVLGPSDLAPLRGVETVDVVSTKDLLAATREAVKGADLVFFAAAPSDWRPTRRRRGKPPREGGEFQLALRPTPDVARTLARGKGDRVHVGFALEVGGGEKRARAKMAKKGFDAVVLNSPANMGRGGGDIWWVPREGAVEALTGRSKSATAKAIVARAWKLMPEA